MKILQVHNKYKITGGEWTVLTQEHNLLKETHQVDQFIVENRKELASFWGKLKLIFQAHYNKKSKIALKKVLIEGKYDIMHVHNFFPLLTPSIFESSRETGVPSVLTLHNYRLIHPNGFMYHNGKIDHRSINGGSAYNCVLDGVYRNSILQTAVAAHMIEYHRKKKTWSRYPTVFIALSKFSKEIFVKGGFPADRIYIKPNFLKDPLKEHQDINLNLRKKKRFIYVGRISYEKGVEDLIRCWMNSDINAELLIAGEGPIKNKLEKLSMSDQSIKWIGKISHTNILNLLSESLAMIFPTKWYEGQPLVLLEALSVGCPIITSKIGNAQDIVEDGITGLHYKPGDMDDLTKQIKILLNNPERVSEFSENARNTYLDKYTPIQNDKCINDIYNIAIEIERELAKKTNYE